MYTIKFSNGLIIENLDMNGNNIVSPVKIDESTFSDGLEKIEIIGDDEKFVYNNAIFVQQIQYDDGKWYIVFREKTEKEILLEKLDKLISTNATDITDLQLAIADIYEMLIK